MGAVALDADVVIGALDPTDPHHPRAIVLLRERADARILIAASAYSECLVGALRRDEAWRVDGMLEDAQAEVVSVDRGIAWRAAELRLRHRSLRLPDAMTLATALEREAELLTFDRRLTRIERGER
jgi:predicted nucleic acid-binding protein